VREKAVDRVKGELVPLLEELVRMAARGGEVAQSEFFSRILGGVRNARVVEDLAGPFMELSQSAFLGFAYSGEVTLQIDRVLAVAQTIAETLSAGEGTTH
jgi:hypothetical protein